MATVNVNTPPQNLVGPHPEMLQKIESEVKNSVSGIDSGSKSAESTTNSQINEESLSNDLHSSSGKSSKDISKRERRLMQNRQSASRLRVKKKQTMAYLTQDKEFLKEENVTLQRKVDLSQKELFETLQESIQLRKKIDDIQKRQNQMLLTFLSETQKSNSSELTRNCTTTQGSKSYIKIQEKKRFVPQPPQVVLGSQNLDFASALNLLVAAQAVGKPIIPTLPTQRIENRIDNLESATFTQESPNALSKILNVLNDNSGQEQSAALFLAKN